MAAVLDAIKENELKLATARAFGHIPQRTMGAGSCS
jgi:hypothetical protein